MKTEGEKGGKKEEFKFGSFKPADVVHKKDSKAETKNKFLASEVEEEYSEIIDDEEEELKRITSKKAEVKPQAKITA